MTGSFVLVRRARPVFTVPATRPFHMADLRRIAAGDLPREVVINSPAKAGSGYEQRAVREGKPTVLRQ
jgi:hypothetical protein